MRLDPPQNSVGTVDRLPPGGYKFEVTQEGDRVKITFTSPEVTDTVRNFLSSR